MNVGHRDRLPLAGRTWKPRTADGRRGMWIRWRWAPGVRALERGVCRERIGEWLVRNGFAGYAFRQIGAGEQLRIRHGDEISRWSRAISDACSLFVGSDRVGPLRSGLVG